MTKINQIHNTIKFTYEVSETELTFLDITLHKGERFDTSQLLDVRTHIKPTNSYIIFMLPHTTSRTTINAISKGKTNRYLRINSNKKRIPNYEAKTDRLLQRGYKYKQILPHINSVKFNQRRSTLFRQRPKENKKKLVFVTQFCDDAKDSNK